MWHYNSYKKQFTTRITHLYTGYGREYVLELEIGPIKKKLEDYNKTIELVKAECKIKGINGSQYNFKKNLKITMLNPQEEVKEAVEDKVTAVQYFRVKVGETIGEAQKLADAGKHKEAKEKI